MSKLSDLPPGVSVLNEHINPAGVPKLNIDDTVVDAWFERDRANVTLYVKPTNSEFVTDGTMIVEYRDSDVYALVEDGFLSPDDWHRSLFAYAQYLGLIA